jgi:restriction system protein
MTSANNAVPSYDELLWPTLQALRALGGTARLEEIDEKVIEIEHFNEAQLAVLHNDGPRSEIEYRLAWARTYLKGMGLVVNTTRGVWEITSEGRLRKHESIEPAWRQYQARLREESRRRKRSLKTAGADLDAEAEHDGTDTWREELLQVLLGMPPDAFERLAQRLLRAAGFLNTRVTGRSGDGGIDGMGVYRLSLVSFPVFFQCKRYKGNVGPDKVRDFRGAMAGRGDKGLLITTGTFTPDARGEATRDGAPPIDLIDGELLCELLKQHSLGVRTAERIVEDVTVVPSFFAQLSEPRA